MRKSAGSLSPSRKAPRQKVYTEMRGERWACLSPRNYVRAGGFGAKHSQLGCANHDIFGCECFAPTRCVRVYVLTLLARSSYHAACSVN